MMMPCTSSIVAQTAAARRPMSDLSEQGQMRMVERRLKAVVTACIAAPTVCAEIWFPAAAPDCNLVLVVSSCWSRSMATVAQSESGGFKAGFFSPPYVEILGKGSDGFEVV